MKRALKVILSRSSECCREVRWNRHWERERQGGPHCWGWLAKIKEGDGFMVWAPDRSGGEVEVGLRGAQGDMPDGLEVSIHVGMKPELAIDWDTTGLQSTPRAMG